METTPPPLASIQALSSQVGDLGLGQDETVEDTLPDHLMVLLAKEEHWETSQGCLDRHPDITASMRHILVDWLMEVTTEYHLERFTLHRAIVLMDKFMKVAVEPVGRTRLQLVGLTCLWIACKFEEIISPSIDDFVYICDNTYSNRQLIDMESVVLRDVGWNVAPATAYEWLEWWLFVYGEDPCHESWTTSGPPSMLTKVCRVLIDVALLTEEALSYSPSKLARACLNAGQLITGDRFEPEDRTRIPALKLLSWAVDAIGDEHREGIRELHQGPHVKRVETTGKLLVNSLQSAKELRRENSLKTHRLSMPIIPVKRN